MPTPVLTDPRRIAAFQETVWSYYRRAKRDMPWRRNPTPYAVLVSELMLQQTQVVRVHQKFGGFMCAFPTLEKLAQAPLGDVLAAWSGLGYNRRAKFLWEAARIITHDFSGQVPQTQADLMRLPGVGINTAGAVLAYAFNQPAVFIETNIRTAFIHHFFNDNSGLVDDESLRQLVAEALPVENPREWYWALMDYGASLKATVGSHLNRVKGYKAQSRFEGSLRQIRGQVLKELLVHKVLTPEELAALIPDNRVAEACQALSREGLIVRRGHNWHLTGAGP